MWTASANPPDGGAGFDAARSLRIFSTRSVTSLLETPKFAGLDMGGVNLLIGALYRLLATSAASMYGVNCLTAAQYCSSPLSEAVLAVFNMQEVLSVLICSTA